MHCRRESGELLRGHEDVTRQLTVVEAQLSSPARPPTAAEMPLANPIRSSSNSASISG